MVDKPHSTVPCATQVEPEACTAESPVKTMPCGRHRESSLLHPLPARHPLTVESASGVYLNLNSGHEVLDASAVTFIDHGNANVQIAVMEQMSRVSYAHTMLHKTESAEKLADLLLESRLFGQGKAYFVSSGSEAMDSAMKCATQYHIANNQPQRQHFVARRQGYHGNTIGAMSISSNVARKGPYGKSLVLHNVSFVSPTYAYRHQRDGETEEEYTTRLLEELDREFQRLGTDKVVAFVAETVGGSTAGCLTSPKGYFKGVRMICDRYGILLILDEVMCGNGRTGTYFAFEAEGNVEPDLVILGKGLASGYAPIAGLLIRQSVYDVLIHHAGGFVEGHTYQAHPISCAAALAVQKEILQPEVLHGCVTKGLRLENCLRMTFNDRKYVGDIRGRGLLWALEFVKDKALKTPFNASIKFSVRVAEVAYELGLAIIPGNGTADGLSGDHVLLAPPLIITEEQLQLMVRVLKEAYDKVEEAYEARALSN